MLINNSISMSDFHVTCFDLFLMIIDRDPLIHKIRVYAIFVRSHCITMLYSISRFSAILNASSHRNLSASLPVPPYGVNTKGVKEPCSTSITH